jgi:GNAT superfamily N-acetyltransferase
MWRLSQPTDDEAILAMCLELYREDPGPKPVPPEHIQRTLSMFRGEPNRGAAYILELAGKLAGYAFLASFWSNELGGEICTVDEFFVQKEFRGRGHGKNLLERLIARDRSLWPRNAVALDLEVTPDNHRARGFYMGLGFKPAKNTHMRMRF